MSSPNPLRRPLEGERFQVIVIGGGIQGAAIARECARTGRRTLLVEQHDFASGATGRSTRLLDGALRSLASKEIAFARELLQEQQRLLAEYPHLVHPANVLLTLASGSPHNSLSAKTTLWLYRKMRGNRGDDSQISFEAKRLERALPNGKTWTISSFEDARCDFPERLVAEWLGDAIEAGAVARNHTQALAVDVRHGRVQGVLLRDLLTGAEERAEATWVVNATGAWADRLCQRSRVRTEKPLLRGFRSTCIVLPTLGGAPESPVLTEGPDGRLFYIRPWNGQTLVGSRYEADASDPTKAEPSAEDVQYLLRSLTQLFPKLNASVEDVRFTYSAIEAFPPSADSDPSRAGLRPAVHPHRAEGAANFISVVGGATITASLAAHECLSAMGIPAKKSIAKGQSAEMLEQWTIEICNTAGISEASSQAIVSWHGARSLEIAKRMVQDSRLRAPLCSHTEHLVAEAVHAMEHEAAITLADVLLRRVPVALGPCWSQACGREAVARIRAVVGWNEKHAAEELETFEMERAAALRQPARRGIALPAAAD